MSRNNIQILIATGLLGVLLVTVWRLTDRLTDPATGEPPVAGSTTPLDLPDAAPALTRPVVQPAGSDSIQIASYTDFVAWLDAQGIEGAGTLAVTAGWYQSRGFLGTDPLLGITGDDAPLVYYESLDDATLEGLRQARDLGATQVLASRLALTDPFAALDLYGEAAGLGSIFAYLQIASLYDTLTAVPLNNVRDSRSMVLRLTGLQQDGRRQAFAHAMAALRDGGPPLADPSVVAWVNRLYQSVPAPQRERACQASEKAYLEIAARRRGNGIAPVAPAPPPVFLSVPDLDGQLPCGDTEFGYYSMLDTGACESVAVVDSQNQPRELFLCPDL